MNLYVWIRLQVCQTLIINIIDLGFLTKVFCCVPNILLQVQSWKKFSDEQCQVFLYYFFVEASEIFGWCLLHLILHPVLLGYEQKTDVTCKFFKKNTNQNCMNHTKWLYLFWQVANILYHFFVGLLPLFVVYSQSKADLLFLMLLGDRVIWSPIFFQKHFEKIINVKNLCINHTNVKK